MTTNLTPTEAPPAAKLLVAGLVIAAAGMLVQYASGVEYPTIPPGPIIALLSAAVVAWTPWRRRAAVGLVAAVFISTGGLVATIAGNGWGPQLSDPGAVGGFAGTLVQIGGLLLAVPAGVAAVRRARARRHSR